MIYVYAGDAACNCAYLGDESAFALYKKMCYVPRGRERLQASCRPSEGVTRIKALP